jgi:hypothetical protein
VSIRHADPSSNSNVSSKYPAVKRRSNEKTMEQHLQRANDNVAAASIEDVLSILGITAQKHRLAAGHDWDRCVDVLCGSHSQGEPNTQRTLSDGHCCRYGASSLSAGRRRSKIRRAGGDAISIQRTLVCSRSGRMRGSRDAGSTLAILLGPSQDISLADACAQNSSYSYPVTHAVSRGGLEVTGTDPPAPLLGLSELSVPVTGNLSLSYFPWSVAAVPPQTTA